MDASVALSIGITIAYLVGVVLAFRYCWRRGHHVAAVSSIFVPYLTPLYVSMIGDARWKVRRDAKRRGADITRWVPCYVDMGKRDGDGKTIMNYSFAVASSTDLLFYECDQDLYDERHTPDPFRYVRRYSGRVARDSVADVFAEPVGRAGMQSARRAAFWKDLLYNKTVGAVFQLNGKTVVMAAHVILEIIEAPASEPRMLLFGVPHSGDVKEGGLLDFVGELLPEGLATTFELGTLMMEYRECSEFDARGLINALAVVAGLKSLLGRHASPEVKRRSTREAATSAGGISRV